MRVGTVRVISIAEPSVYLYINIENKESVERVVMNFGSDGLLAMHSFVGYPITILV